MRPWTVDGLDTLGDWSSWAVLSKCGRYRYALGRTWDPEPDASLWDWQRPTLAIFMLNPSTADHREDDPTIRKVVHFAKQEGCGSVVVRNLAALRATDPAELGRADDPIGPRNLDAIAWPLPLLALRLAAWGALDTRPKRVQQRLAPSVAAVKAATAPCLHVFALTDNGEHPRHPLYLPNATRAVLWDRSLGRAP